jgi:hypothetical protein
VKPGERVVIEGQNQLRPGSALQMKDAGGGGGKDAAGGGRDHGGDGKAAAAGGRNIGGNGPREGGR